MRMTFLFTGLITMLLTAVACDKNEVEPDPTLKNRQLIITDELLSENFVGNGAQWGGYESVQSWIGTETLSDEDWNTSYQRIDFMRPPFLRLMTNSSAYMNKGSFDVNFKTTNLFKMLDYAQSRNIEITYGEWGHHYLNGNLEATDLSWVENAVKFIDYLINEKGYSCIKTINMINEPNGDWSSAKGNYNAWKNVQLAFVDEMKKYDLSSVKLMGPDIAIFSSVSNTEWLSRATNDLGENLGLYDIHVYPKQLIVRNGEYTDMLKAYRKVVPAHKRIVLGEIGFKYDAVDADLKAENEAAIAADPYAGDDSNMMIYRAFHGVDMADALIQSMRAGFSGSLIWDMDDAMYVSPKDGNYNVDQMKRWGFWNILGEEHCGSPEDEAIRPFFYPVSLLCRYFPAGSSVYNIEMPDKRGVRAIMGEKDGQYTIAIVNSHYASYDISLVSEFISNTTMKMYRYKSKDGTEFEGSVDENGLAIPLETAKAMDFENGTEIELQGESFLLFTNME